MADEKQFDIDTDSEIDDNEDHENEESDDDTDFFPIDEPIMHLSQSNTTTSSSQMSKQTTGTSEQSQNKSIGTSNNFLQDNSFEYVGKLMVMISHIMHNRTTNIVFTYFLVFLFLKKKKKSHVYRNKCKLFYLVLSQEDIVKYMVECIREVNEVIKLPSTTVRLLLHHFRWDKEKLMERFYDPDHQDELFRQARIVNPFKNSSHSQTQLLNSSHRATRRQISTTSSSLSPSTPMTQTTNPFQSSTQQICLICYSTKSTNEMAGLECGHIFCKTCWQYYLTIKIIDEGIGQTIPCPAKCDILVDDRTVLNLIENLDVRRKYQHLITNSFVECNRNMRWCPGANCNNAIKASYCDVAMVILQKRTSVLFSFFDFLNCLSLGNLYIMSYIVLFSMWTSLA